jgi:hypothetical protein
MFAERDPKNYATHKNARRIENYFSNTDTENAIKMLIACQIEKMSRLATLMCAARRAKVRITEKHLDTISKYDYSVHGGFASTIAEGWIAAIDGATKDPFETFVQSLNDDDDIVDDLPSDYYDLNPNQFQTFLEHCMDENVLKGNEMTSQLQDNDSVARFENLTYEQWSNFSNRLEQINIDIDVDKMVHDRNLHLFSDNQSDQGNSDSEESPDDRKMPAKETDEESGDESMHDQNLPATEIVADSGSETNSNNSDDENYPNDTVEYQEHHSDTNMEDTTDDEDNVEKAPEENVARAPEKNRDDDSDSSNNSHDNVVLANLVGGNRKIIRFKTP